MSQAWRDLGSNASRTFDSASAAQASIAEFFMAAAQSSDPLVLVSGRATLDGVAALLSSGGYGPPLPSDRIHFVDAETALLRSPHSGALDLARSKAFFGRLLENIRAHETDGTILLFGDAAGMPCEQCNLEAERHFEGLAPELLQIEPRLSILRGHCRPRMSGERRACSKHADGAQSDNTPESGQPPRLSHPSGEPPETVYVIDDDASVRRALGRRLKLTAWTVRTFDSAEAFLAELDSLTLGCLVLDIQLGGMSGLDLLAHMKNNGPDWPVIAMSGSDDDSLEAEALRLGARVFFRKPFDSDLLIDAITLALA